jgi:hypothetical protein
MLYRFKSINFKVSKIPTAVLVVMDKLLNLSEVYFLSYFKMERRLIVVTSKGYEYLEQSMREGSTQHKSNCCSPL